MAQVDIEPGDGVGAYIHGIDLARDLKDGVVADLRQALGDYGVLFFRDQNLAPEDHIAMAECFGKINVNRFFGQVDGHPQIAEVRKEPNQRLKDNRQVINGVVGVHHAIMQEGIHGVPAIKGDRWAAARDAGRKRVHPL